MMSSQDLRSEKMIGTGIERKGLYFLNQAKKGTCNHAKTSNPNLWHQRLGHLLTKVSPLFSKVNSCSNDKCLICPLAKQTRLSFSSSSIITTSSFDLIHVDIWGGYKIPSISGAKYFLMMIILDAHGFYLMKHKSDTRDLLVNFINMAENQFDSKVKMICCDNGLEFKLESFYAHKGITHQTSCINTP